MAVESSRIHAHFASLGTHPAKAKSNAHTKRFMWKAMVPFVQSFVGENTVETARKRSERSLRKLVVQTLGAIEKGQLTQKPASECVRPEVRARADAENRKIAAHALDTILERSLGGSLSERLNGLGRAVPVEWKNRAANGAHLN